MRISEFNMVFTHDDPLYEIKYFFYSYLQDDKTYNLTFIRREIDSYKRHKIILNSTIGNPEYIFNTINEFRKKPEIYFWALNKLFSRKDIKFENPDETTVPILDDDDKTLSLIKFY